MARDKHAASLAGYVAMPDHIHLILLPDERGLPMFMHGFKRTAQLAISQARKTTGPLWQRRYFDNIVRTVRDFWEKLEYIHSNPVTARLASSFCEWRWSSYGAYGGGPAPIIPVNKLNLPTDGNHMLWPASWKRPGE
jgi:putative transposase